VGWHGSFPLTLDSTDALRVNISGIPHLAKNERDMGHPSSFSRDKLKGPVQLLLGSVWRPNSARRSGDSVNRLRKAG
jgi:hypothetical protein